ncbi:hypothetical protein [Myxococcus sp. SDU36]|uniref:hypothetical protein n=1 Tax=Myxococcus sp. SDU36 TaxID=2831967 RepID=UPI0025434EAA|nr:hypothetical protein [Myxococcus sp. SDU36]
MSTGLACDDDGPDSPGNEDRLEDTVPDWYKDTLDLPLVGTPGEKGVYCSANINLLGGRAAQRAAPVDSNVLRGERRRAPAARVERGMAGAW